MALVSPNSLVLDTGALVLLTSHRLDGKRYREDVALAVEDDRLVHVPTPAYAEWIRGGVTERGLDTIAEHCSFVEPTKQHARRAGDLLRALEKVRCTCGNYSGSSLGDALVFAIAEALAAELHSGDSEDMAALASAAGTSLPATRFL